MIRCLVSRPGRASNAARRVVPALTLMVGLAVAVPASAVSVTPEVDAAPLQQPPAMPSRLQVGDATTSLLALQRSGRAASAVAQPISGEVASRSYARYLKSFEFPIPEKLGTSGAQGAGGGSGAGDSSGTAR